MDDKQTTNTPSIDASVEAWKNRIVAAKEHWCADFERMRDNMRFAAGLQWIGQKRIDGDDYVANITLRTVNQKVASLYARNPKAIARRRQRMDFQLWDGNREAVMGALQQEAMAVQAGAPPSPENNAILQDYQAGLQRRALIDRVARTLEIVYQHQVDTHQPEFKKQMKQLVRRTIITGVGFVRVRFERTEKQPFSMQDARTSVVDMAKMAEEILRQAAEGTIDETNEKMVKLRMLTDSISESATDAMPDERLVFETLPSTKLIIDKRCRALKDFVGAHWIAIEYEMDVDEINATFGVDVSLCQPTSNDPDHPLEILRGGMDQEPDKRLFVWEVFDKDTKRTFFLCDGYHDFLRLPEAPLDIARFWPVFALTFNDIETEEGIEGVTVFPPSDVQLLKHAQKEWNRTRNELKRHRSANRPKYFTGAGWLTSDDKERLEDCPSNSVIELQGVPAGADVSKMIVPMEQKGIDPLMYSTEALQQDVLLTTGMQEANLGPVSNATATEATISEQSKNTGIGSNVDDLDDILTDMAQAGGEILLSMMTKATVERIAGPGAAWPGLDASRADFLNEIYLEIEAASSGRPNQAIDIAHFERMAPLLIQAGAKPEFLVREGVKRLDDRIDVEQAFPLVPTAPMPVGGAEQPLQTMPSGSPIPLAGA